MMDPKERALGQLQKRLRFAVEGSNGRFSTAWAIWEHRDTIYVASRTVGGFIKISLHPEGGYRLAFTKEFHPTIRERSPVFATRDLAVWPKPELAGKIALPVAELCFPTDYMRSGHPPSRQGTPYLLSQVPQAGWAANLGFFLSQASAAQSEAFFLTFGKPMFRWDFDDGSSISLVGWASEFDCSVLPDTRPGSVVPLTASGEIGPEHFGDSLTGMLWNKPGPGVPLRILEVGGVALGKSLRQLPPADGAPLHATGLTQPT